MPNLQSLTDIAEHHADAEASLRLLFSTANPNYAARFATYLPKEVNAELIGRIAETDLRSSLTTLARAEAALRVDYRERCRLKKADQVSIAFRKIYKARKDRARLDDDIMKIWCGSVLPADRAAINELRLLFKFRHWLAHGRYWNFAPSHRFQDVYLVADTVIGSLPLYS